MQHQGPLLGTQLAPFGAVVAEAGDGAGQVVVTQKQAVPALAVQSALVAGHGAFEGEGVKAGAPFIAPQPQVLEVEHHTELAVIRVRIVPHLGQISPPGLTDSDDPLAAEAGATQLADIVVQAGAVAHGKP
ncbi:hypothetical protein D3C87_1330660 [compost metagenome]